MMKYRVIQNGCWGFNNLPPRSPNATPCDFFLWGYVKGQVCVPPLPASIPELMEQIRTANETIIAGMLHTVWNHKVCTYRAPVSYVTTNWRVVLLNKKKYIYSCLKCIVYDKLLKPRQSFRITLYLTVLGTDRRFKGQRDSKDSPHDYAIVPKTDAEQMLRLLQEQF